MKNKGKTVASTVFFDLLTTEIKVAAMHGKISKEFAFFGGVASCFLADTVDIVSNSHATSSLFSRDSVAF